MASMYQIEKLDDENYDSWCLQMRSVLIHNGFWKIVSGVLHKESAKDAKETATWEENDERALATITLSVKPNQLNIIKNCKTSNEAWLRLEEIHKPRGPIHKVSLYKRLLNLSMPNGGNISKHINEFTELAEKLAETAIVVQEELLVIMLLSSLPSEFEHFVVAMETRDNLPSLSTVRQKILEEGNRHKDKIEREEASVSTYTQQAFAMKSSVRERSKTQIDAKSEKSKNKFKGKCFNCGETGHFASKCNKKKKQPLLLHARTSTSTIKQAEWCIDSGATAHMCCSREMFTKFVVCDEEISLAGDKQIVAKGKGDVLIKNNNGLQIKLQNVLFSPELHMNFLSVSRVVEKGLIVKFDSASAIIHQSDGTVVLKAIKKDNLFLTKGESHSLCTAVSSNQIWHNRFGHINFQSLCDMANKSVVTGMKLGNVSSAAQCRTCMLSKIHVTPFPQESQTRTKDLLELIHSDVCGPFNINSLGGSRYFVTFIDDCSRRMNSD